MKTIVKSSLNDALRVHHKMTNTKTLCGITFPYAQETILDCDCRRCLSALKRGQRHRRSNRRLNGRKVSAAQISIPTF